MRHTSSITSNFNMKKEYELFYWESQNQISRILWLNFCCIRAFVHYCYDVSFRSEIASIQNQILTSWFKRLRFAQFSEYLHSNISISLSALWKAFFDCQSQTEAHVMWWFDKKNIVQNIFTLLIKIKFIETNNFEDRAEWLHQF